MRHECVMHLRSFRNSLFVILNSDFNHPIHHRCNRRYRTIRRVSHLDIFCHAFRQLPEIHVWFMIPEWENRFIRINPLLHKLTEHSILSSAWPVHVQLSPPFRCATRKVHTVIRVPVLSQQSAIRITISMPMCPGHGFPPALFVAGRCPVESRILNS